jgi:hypothetical protein
VTTLQLPVGSYRLPLPDASCRRLLNCYAQEAPAERPRGQPIALKRAPGIKPFSVTAEMHAKPEIRGAIVMAGVLYVVAGDVVYSVSSVGVATALTGVAIAGSGLVKLTTNGTSFIICTSGGAGYFSTGATITAISDVTFTGGGGTDPVFVDGYIVFRRLNTAQFFNTVINAITFNALDLATAEGAPDKLIGMIANHRELILAGETSIERWYNAAQSPGSPFARSPNGFHEIGCAAGDSLANQDNAVLMLANDRTIRRLSDGWNRVSHDGVDAAIQRMTVVNDCVAIPYRQEGHHFVAFTFRNAGRTFVLDANTGEWHERESHINTVSLGYWRPSLCIQAYGMQIVGDSQSGKLGILDPETQEEFGEPQRVSFTFQPVYADSRLVIHKSLTLGVTAGQGSAIGQGVDPLVTLFISDDGGNTFRAKPVRALGKMGEYRRRVAWWGLGSSRERVYRLEFSDPVPMMMIDAQLDAQGARL